METKTLEHATAQAVAQMEDYYARRASHYDTNLGYRHPQAAAHFASMKAQLQIAMYGHEVLEVACGTGSWTEAVAQTARSIVATDLNEEMLVVARQRISALPNVRLQIADAYSLYEVPGSFTAAFAAYWWSHVPVSKIEIFLASLHSKLKPGGTVLFMDDLANEGGKFRPSKTGDALRQRRLRDSGEYAIIKNVPTRQELLAALADIAEDIVYTKHPIGRCAYWTVAYKTKGFTPSACT